jgi:hypothetical protein
MLLKLEPNRSIYYRLDSLSQNANIKKYIDERIADKDSKRIAKQDEVLEFLTNVLRGQVKEQFPLGLGKRLVVSF